MNPKGFSLRLCALAVGFVLESLRIRWALRQNFEAIVYHFSADGPNLWGTFVLQSLWPNA